MHVFTQQKNLHFVKNWVYSLLISNDILLKLALKKIIPDVLMHSIIEVNYFLIIAVFMNY